MTRATPSGRAGRLPSASQTRPRQVLSVRFRSLAIYGRHRSAWCRCRASYRRYRAVGQSNRGRSDTGVGRSPGNLQVKTQRGLKQKEMSGPLRYLSFLKQQGATLFATHLLKARTVPDAVKTWRGRLWPRSLAAENTPFGGNTGSDDGSDRSLAGMAFKIACGPQQKAVSVYRIADQSRDGHGFSVA
jgi:hypothetical protein